MSPGKGLWEMESWVKWQESGVEWPLAKFTGTPARDRDIIIDYTLLTELNTIWLQQ